MSMDVICMTCLHTVPADDEGQPQTHTRRRAAMLEISPFGGFRTDKPAYEDVPCTGRAVTSDDRIRWASNYVRAKYGHLSIR